MTANVTNDVFRAVLHKECKLTPRLRLFALALAQLANWRTGRGIAGQGRLAAVMGCDIRTARRLKSGLTGAGCPVVVTWRHRKRTDGLNGSDAYTIGLTEFGRSLLVHTGQSCEDTGQSGTAHRTNNPTNITSGSPQRTPEIMRAEIISFPDTGVSLPTGADVSGAASLLPPGWQPNATHRRSAARLGVNLTEAAEGFVAYWTGRAGSERTRNGWGAAFGGWLKRQTPDAGPTGEVEWLAAEAESKAAEAEAAASREEWRKQIAAEKERDAKCDEC